MCCSWILRFWRNHAYLWSIDSAAMCFWGSRGTINTCITSMTLAYSLFLVDSEVLEKPWILQEQEECYNICISHWFWGAGGIVDASTASSSYHIFCSLSSWGPGETWPPPEHATYYYFPCAFSLILFLNVVVICRLIIIANISNMYGFPVHVRALCVTCA